MFRYSRALSLGLLLTYCSAPQSQLNYTPHAHSPDAAVTDNGNTASAVSKGATANANVAGSAPASSGDLTASVTSAGTTATSVSQGTAGGVTQLSLTCAQIAGVGQPGIEIHAAHSPGTSFQLKGQICPADASGLAPDVTVLLVVDSAASMTQSDPTTNATCGRLTAAQAIVTTLQGQAQAGATINVGYIPFADAVTATAVVNPMPLAAFNAQLTAANFCQAAGLSNYISAFQAAQTMLTNATGQSIVYFMSDGMPSTGVTAPTDVVQASETAAQTLANSSTKPTIYGVILGNAVAAGTAVMTTVAGAVARVAPPAKAATLATSAVVFPSLNTSSATLSLATGGSSQLQTVSLTGFSADATAPATWDFVTQPFTLSSTSNLTVLDTLILQVATQSGTPQLVTFTFRVSDN